jgi:hypothetical protein
MATPVEEESLVGKTRTHRDKSDQYGAVELSSDELASRASYAEYHKVCDMRVVFDTTPVGIAGIALTFLLVFTSWCAWHELVEWTGIKLSYTGQSLVEFSAVVNAVAMAILVAFVVTMRLTVGPILSLTWRAVFACLLVMTAIALWEALEAVIDMLVGTDAGNRAIFYGISCASAIVAIGAFELIFRYDIIGNHLLVPP